MCFSRLQNNIVVILQKCSTVYHSQKRKTKKPYFLVNRDQNATVCDDFLLGGVNDKTRKWCTDIISVCKNVSSFESFSFLQYSFGAFAPR
jgi:hypothetical protein